VRGWGSEEKRFSNPDRLDYALSRSWLLGANAPKWCEWGRSDLPKWAANRAERHQAYHTARAALWLRSSAGRRLRLRPPSIGRPPSLSPLSTQHNSTVQRPALYPSIAFPVPGWTGRGEVPGATEVTAVIRVAGASSRSLGTSTTIGQNHSIAILGHVSQEQHEPWYSRRCFRDRGVGLVGRGRGGSARGLDRRSLSRTREIGDLELGGDVDRRRDPPIRIWRDHADPPCSWGMVGGAPSGFLAGLAAS
jgi:hypothetical protein